MPAIAVADLDMLPRLRREPLGSTRPVVSVTRALSALEGAGFPVFRGFAGLDLRAIDPFVLLDQLGPIFNEPYQTKGAPWHPHRGFETVTYIIDGAVEHHDSTGGGGIISDGDTQWMTAGAGILHDEVPTEEGFALGGPQHGVQLWVNLPARLKFTAPRYQAIAGSELTLFTNDDASAIIRLIAGTIGEFSGPGSTHTPITLAHATLKPGATVTIPWDTTHNAMAYALLGRGTTGPDHTELSAHQLAYFGAGDAVSVHASASVDEPFEVLLLGGEPINEPIVHYGPFVMNTEAEIRQAFHDYEAGRMGTAPRRRY